MFQNELNDYLIEKLNENTQGLVFHGEYLFSINNGKFVIETQTGYNIEETEFIPTMVQDWRNTNQPYKRIDLQDLMIPLSLAIRESQLDDALLAIEDFRTSLNGGSDTIDGLNVGFRVSQPSSPSAALKHAGHNWVLVDIVIMLSAGAHLLFGNAIEFKMAKTTETLVEIVYSDIVITTTATNSTSSPTFTSGTRLAKSLEQIKITVFYEDNIDLMADLQDWLWQVTLNEKFDISVKYSDTDTRTATCVIISSMQVIKAGVPIGFDMTLVKAK